MIWTFSQVIIMLMLIWLGYLMMSVWIDKRKYGSDSGL